MATPEEFEARHIGGRDRRPTTSMFVTIDLSILKPSRHHECIRKTTQVALRVAQSVCIVLILQSGNHDAQAGSWGRGVLGLLRLVALDSRSFARLPRLPSPLPVAALEHGLDGLPR